MSDTPFDRGQNYTPPGETPFKAADVTVITGDGDDAGVTYDDATGSTQIPLPDGMIEISFGVKPHDEKKSEDFNDNLAEYLSDSELDALAERLMLGIDQDIQSRSEWLENMSNGISLLGLELKNPRGAAATGATPAEGVSVVDHPLLLEAVLDFQANAIGELLPADGPVKVRNDGYGNALNDELAMALEKDMNHYLTKTAKEYRHDTDRMLLMLGFSGISFKKGFHDPIKRRPVIMSIDAKDLIVSNAATDLDGAGRVTHRIMMGHSTLRRMQLVGAYRDIDLPLPGMPENKNPVDAKIDQVQGIAPATYSNQEDQDREIYECYCEVEVPGFEHVMDNEHTGLPLPYKVVLDKETRKILEIRRNWVEDDILCMPINRIVAYRFIPGFGFYGIGLLNVLGNATKAVTAAWRLLIDSGMFSNFPGFLYLKSLGKQMTNQFRIPPGGGLGIDTVGNDIRASVMPVPYNPPNAVFMQLVDNVVQTAQRVGGSAQKMIGEGKQDAPVGTVLALIEQATKLMSAVHKRLHHSLDQELDMLKSLLMEDPEALWRHNKKSETLRYMMQMTGQSAVLDAQEEAENQHRMLFLAALSEAELTPRSDPNTSSQTERYLKVTALRQMGMSNQGLDLDAIDRYAMRVMGISDPQTFFKPPPPPGAQQPPSPESITAQATMIAANARVTDAQTKTVLAQQKGAQDLRDQQQDAAIKTQELESKERIANLGVARELVIHNSDQQADKEAQGVETQQRGADRSHDIAMQSLENRATLQQSGLDRAHEAHLSGVANKHDVGMAHLGNAHEANMAKLGHQQDATMAQGGQVHEGVMAHVEHGHDMHKDAVQRQHELLLERIRADAAAKAAQNKPAPQKRAMGGRVMMPESQQSDQLADAMRMMARAMSDFSAAQTAPRYIMRDHNGRALGVRIGTADVQQPGRTDLTQNTDGSVTVDLDE